MPASRKKAVTAPPPLQVTVVNGDLTFIRQPFLLGHYRSARLSGAEAVMNGVLGGGMQRSLDAGLYPTHTGTHQVFLNTVGDPRNPWRPPRPEAVIVVGLGPEGELRAVDLVATVRQGAIAWAQRRMEEPDAVSSLELSATLIGSGGSGISAGQSAQLIAQGVREANDQLSAAKWPRIGRLLLIELYEDRATEAWRALRALAADAPNAIALSDGIELGMGALSRPLDANYRGASYDFISAQTRQDPATGTSIDYALDTKRARTEVRGKSLQAELVHGLIASAASDENTDAQIGSTLFRLLIPLEVTPFLSGTTEMLLEVDPGTAGIPWELLDVPSGGGDARPWAIRSKLLRKLRTRQPREQPVDADAEASVLVVGEPAADTRYYPRLPGARLEAAAVADCLSGGLGKDAVRAIISPADPKKKGADARTIVNALMERPWRVVHVAGHGEPPSEEGPGGVVLSNDTFLGPAEINSMPVVPELVFVNCCFLAQRVPGQLLVEQRAIADPAKFAATVADKLIEIGVRCVVAAGWAVGDDAACAFATAFYDALMRGRRFMDAANEARVAAHAVGDNTWAAYQCYGDPDWTLRRDAAGAVRTPRSMEEEFDGVASPSTLQLALETIEVGTIFQKRSREGQIGKLTFLESRYGGVWGDDGATAEAFGRAWSAVGDRKRAVAWFTRAVDALDGTASLRALEQVGEQRSAIAWASLAAARRTGKGKFGKSLAESRAALASAVELLRRLNEIQPTMKREALVGSALKRLAVLETMAGEQDAARDAVSAMAAHYAEAERLGRASDEDDVFYPTLNRLAAEIVLGFGDAKRKSLSARVLGAVRRELDARAKQDPDFWTYSDDAIIALLEALASGSLAECRSAIEAQLETLFAKVGDAELWTSVREQAEFVLLPYAALESGEEREAARALLALLDRFAGTHR
jgi:hypothetical protein